MNTTRFPQLTRIAGLTLSLFLLAGLAGAQEKFTGKGGAGGLLSAPKATKSVLVAEPASCPKCKDQWTTRTDFSTRGAQKPVIRVAQHTCSGCQTTLSLAGQGKAVHQVATHTCNAAATATLACCAAQTGSTPVCK